MKALIVADDAVAIERFSAVLKSAGYDVIVYRWLIKALDNIEEISPHLILVSAIEYPRHWKALASYSQSGICEVAPQIVLFVDENFSEEEVKKAANLGVRGIFSSYNVDGLDKLRKILTRQDDIYEGNLNQDCLNSEKTLDSPLPAQQSSLMKTCEKENVLTVDSILSQNQGYDESQADENLMNFAESCEIDSKDADSAEYSENCSDISIMFTNPVTGRIMSGKVVCYSEKSLEFKPDFCENLPVKGSEIKDAVLKVGNNIFCIEAVVDDNSNNLILGIVSKV